MFSDDIFQLRAIIDQHKHRVRLRQTEFSTADDYTTVSDTRTLTDNLSNICSVSQCKTIYMYFWDH